MKKIFLIMAVLAISYISKSQGVTLNQTLSNPTGAITNAGIDTSSITLTHGYSRLLFGMTYTRSANTGAGTAILEYRISSTDNYKSDAGDTLTVANAASQTLYWNKTNSARQWRVRVGGATTVTATVVTKVQTD